MGKYVAALFANNRAVVGLNHGDAYSKLSSQEKDGDIESGFIDTETGKFFSDNIKIYLKQVYLIRHGEATGQEQQSKLTKFGILQSHVLAETISNKNISEFEFFSSPFLRCKQTAEIIEEKTGLKFCAKEELRKQDAQERPEHFCERMTDLIETLPEKSILVTHSDVIINVVAQMVGTLVMSVPNCSISYVSSRELIISQNSGQQI
jgi:broad specificity phosphatase PhoE